MKKLTAIVLAVILVASLCTVFSFAEDANLVLGLKPMTATGEELVGYYTDPDVQWPADYRADLTDGNAATELTYDDNWFAFYFNTDAATTNAPDKVGTILFDLGENCTVNSVRVNTFLGNASGITPPQSIVVEYSVDGSSYNEFASKSFESPAENDKTVSWVEFTGDAFVARYVKVTVNLAGYFAFLNEVEVLGEKGGDPSNNPQPTESEEDTASEDVASEDVASEDVASEDVASEDTASEEAPTESTESEAPATEDEANLTWLWIVIAVVVVAAVVAVVVVSSGKKKSK